MSVKARGHCLKEYLVYAGHVKCGIAGKESTLKVRGLFYGIGHQPNSHLFAEDIDLDEAGYVKARPLTDSFSKHLSWNLPNTRDSRKMGLNTINQTSAMRAVGKALLHRRKI